MELNKIIRRTGIPHSAVYAKFVADLTDATKDINGMTKEEVKLFDSENPRWKDYFSDRK